MDGATNMSRIREVRCVTLVRERSMHFLKAFWWFHLVEEHNRHLLEQDDLGTLVE
jgi:hypothetical protein